MEVKNFEFRPYVKCPTCGSNELLVLVRPNANQARQKCLDCGWESTAIPHETGAQRKSNHAAAQWSHEVREKDNYKCHICGNTERVEAHHIIPVSADRQFMYSVNNGIALCNRCHALVHKGYGTRAE